MSVFVLRKAPCHETRQRRRLSRRTLQAPMTAAISGISATGPWTLMHSSSSGSNSRRCQESRRFNFFIRTASRFGQRSLSRGREDGGAAVRGTHALGRCDHAQEQVCCFLPHCNAASPHSWTIHTMLTTTGPADEIRALVAIAAPVGQLRAASPLAAGRVALCDHLVVLIKQFGILSRKGHSHA